MAVNMAINNQESQRGFDKNQATLRNKRPMILKIRKAEK
jgi:hypothetical protein